MCFVSVNYVSITVEPWITIIAILIILALIIVVIRKRRRLWSFYKTWKTASVIAKGEEQGLYLVSSNYDKNLDCSSRINPYKDLNRQAALLSYDTNREIPRSLFSINEYIGSGNFGKVCKGELKGLYSPDSKTTVAIKSIDGPADGPELRDFLHEIKIMSHIKPHSFLVSMIGSCCLDEGETREMWLIIEYCPNSDLKNFLIENKKKLLSENDLNPINCRCLIYWAYEISKGMQYLAQNKIMHGDLAARNILLDDNLIQPGHPIAKIADFGLSKKFYENLTYAKESRVFVPWRWMAIEYMTCSYFTMASDVWSFMVVLWEIFSLGRLPYGQQDYEDVLKQLEEGFRLECPKDINEIKEWCPAKIYESLSNICFIGDPNERGSFDEVVQIMENEFTENEKMRYEELNIKYHDQRGHNYMNIGQFKK